MPDSPVGAAQVTAFSRPAGAYGRDRYLLTNQTGDPATSWALEATVRATTEKLELLVGLGLTEANGPAAAVGFLATENDQDVLGNMFVDPNAQTKARGQLFQDRSHIGKIAAAYHFPWRTTVGAIFRYADGQPFTRLVIAPALTQGPAAVRSYANGGSAFTFVGTIDVRVQKAFTVGRAEVAAVVDVYNLPNLDNEVIEHVVTGPAFRHADRAAAAAHRGGGPARGVLKRRRMRLDETVERIHRNADAVPRGRRVGAGRRGAGPDDTRTQYPAFMRDSYVSLRGGYIGYLFTATQLEPGFQAESIERPRPAVRLDFFGHHFTKNLAAQVTYMRPGPVRRIQQHQRQERQSSGVERLRRADLRLGTAADRPKLSAYVEGGYGVTSRSGIVIDGKTALQPAHYGSALVGGGLAITGRRRSTSCSARPIRRAARRSSSRRRACTPPALRYNMRALPAATVAENRDAGFLFPANIVRAGYSTNLLGYGVNDLFSKWVVIFWGGHVDTKQGGSIEYERNVFHTKKRFAVRPRRQRVDLADRRQEPDVPHAVGLPAGPILPHAQRHRRRLLQLLDRRADLHQRVPARRSQHRRDVHLPGHDGRRRVLRQVAAPERRGQHQALLERQPRDVERRHQDSADVQGRASILTEAGS